MIDKIQKYINTTKNSFKYSIIIPSWNNVDYLKLCINSLRENSYHDLQIIVLVNEGLDNTLDWLRNQGDVDYIHASENIGICYGLNLSRSLVKSNYIAYINDDMYVLPDWDKHLFDVIDTLETKFFMLSSTMIEPSSTGNSCVVVKNYGNDIETFRKNDLLVEYMNLVRADWSGSTWPINIVHIDVWDLVGGLSTEFTPGMYSDPDFSKKLYDAGVRIFMGVGSSLVYHFGSKSTRRVRKNTGRDQFIAKWGISSNYFTKNYLKLGEEYSGSLKEISVSWNSRILNKLKTLQSVLRR